MHYRGKYFRMIAKNDAVIKSILADERFHVTSKGRVYTRINTNGIGLMPNEAWRRCDVLDGNGYRVIHLSLYSKGRRRRKRLRVHRMVFQKYGGELDCTKVINHKDGNKQNNDYNNLEQIEGGENTLHAINELGHSPIRNAVLSFAIAEEIRLLSRNGMSYGKISEKFGISKGHISEIVNYKIWNERASFDAEQSTPVPF